MEKATADASKQFRDNGSNIAAALFETAGSAVIRSNNREMAKTFFRDYSWNEVN